MLLRIFFISIIFLFFISCSNKKDQLIYEPTEIIDPYSSYKEGLDAFERNDYFLQMKNFLKQK